MSARPLALLAFLGLALAVTLPGRSSVADEAVSANDRDRVVAEALESSNVRMRAKLEAAAILEKLGRHDEALVALEAVEVIHREGKAFLERWAATASEAGASPGMRTKITMGSKRPVGLRVPAPAPPPVIEWRPPTYVAAAQAYLLAAQGIDGWFRPGTTAEAAPDVDLSALRDVHTTAMSLIALCDTLDESYGRFPRLVQALTMGVAALLSSQGDAGAFGSADDLEGHMLATWAVASGVARLAEATWREPAQLALTRAIAFALTKRDESGLWRTTGGAGVDWVLSAYAASAMNEVSELPAAFRGSHDLAAALTAVQAGARASESNGLDPAARFAHALLVSEVRPDAGALPDRADGETAFLLGTTYRFFRAAGFDAWKADVMDVEAGRQRPDGVLRGSWDPVDTRSKAHGRTYATACRLLAALVPETDYVEAAGD